MLGERMGARAKKKTKGKVPGKGPVKAPGASFPIVGIGASAGGLEAFTQLLGALPLNTGMGFVLVQHLDPDHESALTQILSRATSLPVREITNDERVLPDHVYIIPRDTNLSIVKGILKLEQRPRTRVPHRPIDSFFESLAQDQHEHSVGVVLSGTATDGTLGLEAIKAEGGITFAQDESAKHDSMPRSAVAAGCVDLVLSPADIGKELARIAKHPAVTRGASLAARESEQAAQSSGKRGSTEGAEPKGSQAYKKIVVLLRNHSGVDFSLYKSTTIQRRITRRLVLNRLNTMEDYAGFLKGNGEELDALYADVLISVTSFFRNPEAFDVIKHKVLPALLKQRGDVPIRCWVLGCSTGQEAYSLAMTFVEAAEKAPRLRKLQIFATDLNEALLEKARQGLYAKTLVSDISPQRLSRFFVEEAGGFRINKALREMVVFARQNLIADAPFSRMDLISCRNLLIYLEPSLQMKAIPTFHFALKPGGFLLLGASESVGTFTGLFETLDKKHKIYSKKVAPIQAIHLPVRKEHGEQRRGQHPPLSMRPSSSELDVPESMRGELNAQREADRITVNQFAPPGVLVNAELQVLQFRGLTSAFLEPPVGKASFDVLKMARAGLMLPLRSAITQARKENQTARKENIRVTRDGKTSSVSLEVIPLKNLRERGFLILFDDGPANGKANGKKNGLRERPKPTRARVGRPSAAESGDRIAALEAELSETREYLQVMQEQHEAANEELQAANEEVQSANEELQSVNEELETSKEELESANEELTTVNEEMSNRNLELNRVNSDMVNFQNSTKVATILLGLDLNIRRFGPQAEKQFGLVLSDVGRPVGHIRHKLVLGDATESPIDLEDLCAEVISSAKELEREVRTKKGQWLSLRVRPYLTHDSKVDGAVIVVVDIDSLKNSEQAMGKLNAELRLSEERLSEADLRKNEFLSMLGHELRNPLSAIRYGLDLLEKVSENRARSEDLRGMMLRQTKRISTLLDQLLDIARVFSGKVELSTLRIDLADVVRVAVETVMPLLESQKHKITLSLPAEHAFVMGDTVRLSQVVENVLTNAAKYTSPGGEITLTLTLASDPDEARIIVRDTGVGMSAEFVPHVFEVFSQAPRSLDRSMGGLGLGLPLVQRLVEMHGGTVSASSPGLGKGSEFTITLPRSPEMSAKERLEHERAPAVPAMARPCRILVVDDEVDMAEMLAELLAEDGHETRAVHDGPAALAAIREFAPEVALVDLGLPDMDGYQIAKKIREEHPDRKMLLIAVTGYQDDPLRLKAAGFDGHLIKPPDMRRLTAMLEARLLH